jgi:hypothetical protein
VNHPRTSLSTLRDPDHPLGSPTTGFTPTTASGVASQHRVSYATVSIDRTDDGPSLIDSWISVAQDQVKAAAQVTPPGSGAFDLDAPNSHEAGIALLESMRRLIRERRTPAVIAGFVDRLPEDVADYLHAGASYVMYIFCPLP